MATWQTVPSGVTIENGRMVISVDNINALFEARLKAGVSRAPGATSSYLFTNYYNPPANAANRFVSVSGNDANDGLTPQTAWKTLAKVQATWEIGRKVYLKGGDTFTGHLAPTEIFSTSANPLIISSYGKGRAHVISDAEIGIDIAGCYHAEVSMLEVSSTITNATTVTGIRLIGWPDVAARHPGISVKECIVHGFYGGGIYTTTSDVSGFDDLLISKCTVYDCADYGISFWADSVNISLNTKVMSCLAYNILGATHITTSNTGSGIIAAGHKDLLIEGCEAYNCGQNNSYSGGGPVGIWTYDCQNPIIRFCESHHNKTGTVDGGGFDLDGGTTNGVTEYCYSHDNQGPGYLSCSYTGAPSMSGNQIRFNLSYNDSTKAYIAAIGAYTNNNPNLAVYNNTVVVKASAGKTPVGLCIEGSNACKVFNNIVVGEPGTLLLDNISPNTNQLTTNNLYYMIDKTNQTPFKVGGVTYATIADVQATGANREVNSIEVDPMLTSNTNYVTLNITTTNKEVSDILSPKLQAGSPARDAGISLASMGLPTTPALPAQDYYGVPSANWGTMNIGLMQDTI